MPNDPAAQPRAGEIEASFDPLPPKDVLAARWIDLEARSDAPFFLTWDWIGCWLDVVAPEDPRLLTVTRDGRIIGLAIWVPHLVRRHCIVRSRTLHLHRTGNPAKDEMWIEYNGWLAARNEEDAVSRAVRMRLEAVPDWDELVIGVSDTSWLATARPECLSAHMLWLAPSFRTDLAAVREHKSLGPMLSANTRQQLNRALKGYGAVGPLSLRPARDLPEAFAFLDRAAALHGARWNGAGAKLGFQNPIFARFHRQLITAAFPKGKAEILKVAAGETEIGYLYTFLHGDIVCFYLSGLAYTDDAKLKPGLCAHALAIEHYADRGFAIYDFMGGDARYKRSLGVAGPDLAVEAWQRPRLALRLESFARSVKRRLKAKTSSATN